MNKVYIAGAGAGDISCLSIGVKDIIEKADIILYDNLVCDEIILIAKKDAILIDVGKISGHHKVSQDNINKLLLKYSKKYETVLRLKGGDPFIFGRGAEEAEFLQKNNVDFEIMQGISSVISVPESLGIPLTHRDYSSSFFVISANKKKNSTLSEKDYLNISNLENTTLVFLMSSKKANIIAKNLIKCGKDENTKAVIISNGTRANVKKYKYTLKELSNIKDDIVFETPSMLIVGEVVKFTDILDFRYKKPLHSKRIIINVSKEKGNRLEKSLQNLGAQVVNLSTNYLEKKYNNEEFLRLFSDNQQKYICFTSTYSIDIFFEILKENEIDIRILSNYKIACIGQASADKLKQYGLIADLVPDIYNAKSLADTLIEKNVKEVICILPHNVKSDLYEELKKNNINTQKICIYEKYINKVRIYNQNQDDIYVFTSSSSVLGLVNSYTKGHFKDKTAFCIGEKTKNTAKTYEFKTIVSKKASISSLVDCILQYYKYHK